MQCDICGREGALYKTLIENSEMDVCDSCSKFGKKLTFSSQPKNDKKTALKNKTIFILIGYSKIIKEMREKLNLTQEELARKMNIKESVIHKIENGSIEPDIELAKKLEKFFSIKIISEYTDDNFIPVKKGTNKLTIGDLLKEKN